MVVGIKDGMKLAGITIIACCAVFVCTLFLNYNMDLLSIEKEITTEAGMALYRAQVSMGKVTCGVTGGCLVTTSIIMLLFYIKNYIDAHGSQLGLLKALGYSNLRVAKHFWVFGLSVFLGCMLGFGAGFLYLPSFYEKQNGEGLFPELAVSFHPLLAFLLCGAPAVLFMVLSVFYGYWRLKSPVLDLLREKREYKFKRERKEGGERSFLQDLKAHTLKGKKSLVFFMAFSAFCFSAMTQMAMSMNELASQTFAYMVLIIGLILAFTTLFLSLFSVLKANTKTMAMMRVFGYAHKDCSRAVLGGYRPVTYIGFAAGSVYQYGLLKIVMTLVFSDIEGIPEYQFNRKALVISLVVFLLFYEAVLYVYSLRIRKLPVKAVMSE